MTLYGQFLPLLLPHEGYRDTLVWVYTVLNGSPLPAGRVGGGRTAGCVRRAGYRIHGFSTIQLYYLVWTHYVSVTHSPTVFSIQCTLPVRKDIGETLSAARLYRLRHWARTEVHIGYGGDTDSHIPDTDVVQA